MNKTAPYDLNLEMSIIGIIFKKPELITSVTCKPEWFYIPDHNRIWKSFLKLHGKKPIDFLTVSEETKLSVSDLMTFVDVSDYLSSLETYIERLRNLFMLREIVDACHRVIDRSTGSTDPSEVIQIINSTVSRLSDISSVDEELMSSVMLKVLDSLCDDARPSGLNTGYPGLHKIIGGLLPGDVMIIAARPGIGKTAFALNLAMKQLESGVLLFTVEMTRDQIIKRIISLLTGISNTRLKAGNIVDKDIPKIEKALTAIDGKKLFIDDTSGLTLNDMKLKVSKRKDEIGLVIIDYLQLMRHGKSGDNRFNEMSTIIREIKNIAKAVRLPIIVLSQLSRDIESREKFNKDGKPVEPRLSDLRETGEIEQVADYVLFVHRSYYSPITDFQDCEILVAKNRNGSLGRVKMKFTPDQFKFEEI